jgi:hypothetical protein
MLQASLGHPMKKHNVQAVNLVHPQYTATHSATQPEKVTPIPCSFFLEKSRPKKASLLRQ